MLLSYSIILYNFVFYLFFNTKHKNVYTFNLQVCTITCHLSFLWIRITMFSLLHSNLNIIFIIKTLNDIMIFLQSFFNGLKLSVCVICLLTVVCLYVIIEEERTIKKPKKKKFCGQIYYRYILVHSLC